MITARSLTVRAGRRVLLSGVNLDVPTGSVTGIIGPNGSGKTTLLRALVRAVTVSSGTVEVDGIDTLTRSRRWLAQRISTVGQRLEPDPALSVADEVALGGLARGGVLHGGGARFDERVSAALSRVALADRASDTLGTLSGGELQRVAIARAIAHGAGHVLLDEPTNHLDLRHRLEVLHLLRVVAPTVVVVLHDLEVAAEVYDQVLMLDHGQVIDAGNPRDVLRPILIDRVYGVRTTRVKNPQSALRFSFTLPPTPTINHGTMQRKTYE